MNKDEMLKAYQQMLKIRLIEERLVKIYLERNIRSFIHFCIGQEAIAVGTCMNLSKEDLAFGNFRSHGHYLAKGGDMNRMVAELMGKLTGCSRGRGGSMHLIDKSVGFMGCVPILASIVPIAVGAAFAIQKRNLPHRCVVFLGDGACGEGHFYESLNLAALFHLPILFVIENNLYAVISKMDARHAPTYCLESITKGLGVNYFHADGNNVIHVFDTVKSSLTQMPAVIGCDTYRHMAHSGPVFDDHLGYRIIDTYNIRIQNCPIQKIRKELLDLSLAAKIEIQIREEVESAIIFADESPFPTQILEGVYAE